MLYNKFMNNTTFVTYTSVRGNVLKTKDVEAAASRFITPDVKPGQSYVESVLFAKAKRSGGSYKGKRGKVVGAK